MGWERESEREEGEMKERSGREAERLFLLSCSKYKHVRRRISSSVG